MVSHFLFIFCWFLIVYGILVYFKDTNMQVYHRYMIQYSMILPYYVKVDHTLTFVNSKFASDPDIHLKIDNGGRLKTNLYDKHDDFTFPISQ